MIARVSQKRRSLEDRSNEISARLREELIEARRLSG